MQLNKALLAAALATLVTTMPAVAQTYSDHPHMGDWGWGGMAFGPLMMIVFLSMAVVLIVVLVRWLGGSDPAVHPHNPPGKTPMQILEERFAKGEIDTDEFEERKRVLG